MEWRAAGDDGSGRRSALPQSQGEHRKRMSMAGFFQFPGGGLPRARTGRARHLLVLASLCLALLAPGAQAAKLLVFAAASLKPALDSVLATPQAQAIGDITVSYAASSQLARQIE